MFKNLFTSLEVGGRAVLAILTKADYSCFHVCLLTNLVSTYYITLKQHIR